jgi:hypothetical protein
MTSAESILSEDIEAKLRTLLHRFAPQEARWRYFQRGRGPMFVWTVEPFNLRNPDHPANGKYESVVYLPFGRGSRSGKASEWKRDEDSASLHALRRDAKARALRLFREWEEAQP